MRGQTWCLSRARPARTDAVGVAAGRPGRRFNRASSVYDGRSRSQSLPEDKLPRRLPMVRSFIDSGRHATLLTVRLGAAGAAVWRPGSSAAADA